MPNIDM